MSELSGSPEDVPEGQQATGQHAGVQNAAVQDQRSLNGTVQSVDRALCLLELIAQPGAGRGVTQLAAELGIHKSTASRLLATLEAHDLVKADREGYRLGLGLLALAGAASSSVDLVSVVHPTLVDLSRATGETSNLAVLAQGCALYLDQVSAAATLRAHSWVGQRVPLHATSNGKVLLAFSAADVVEQALSGALDAHTPSTLTDPADLRAELHRVRASGWAAAVDEWEVGLTAVAAPVRGPRGELLGSVSVSGPTFRMQDRLDAVGAEVMAAAAAVTAGMPPA